jgi:hypothetical protein
MKESIFITLIVFCYFFASLLFHFVFLRTGKKYYLLVVALYLMVTVAFFMLAASIWDYFFPLRFYEFEDPSARILAVAICFCLLAAFMNLVVAVSKIEKKGWRSKITSGRVPGNIRVIRPADRTVSTASS